jgi:hypothetical protein
MKPGFPFLKYIDREAFIWFAGLLFLAIAPITQSHFTVCPLKLLGFEYCPGCGLGLSIHYLFTFAFKESFKVHPLGLLALIIIIHRICSLQFNRLLPLIKKHNLGEVHE